MQTITNLDDLDRMLAECARAAQISDDELRRVFQMFRMDVSAQLPPDPFSAEYASAQMALYERISGRRYSIRNEESIIDSKAAVTRPFPYTASCQVAGAHLGAIGLLLRSMQIRPGGQVLDVGAGWGNTTLVLAQLGFEVTALDIEPRFCELIGERARRIGVQVEVVNNDFFWIEKSARRFDAIVFFESFHHCADHLRLMRSLGPVLAPGGHVYFGAEPITPDLPAAWGLRTDGESLWAIRRNGWLELGFQPDYFRRALQQAGFIAVVHTSADLPWINVWDAKIGSPEPTKNAAPDPSLGTQTAVREHGSTRLDAASQGDTPQVDSCPERIRQPEARPLPRVKHLLNRLRDTGDRLTGGGIRALLKRLLPTSLPYPTPLSHGHRRVRGTRLQPHEAIPASERSSTHVTGFIVDVYRGLLGRDPDQVGMRHFQNMLATGSLDRIGLINTILSSEEFNSRMIGGARHQRDAPHGCLRSEAESVFNSFRKYHGSGRPGFVTNFLGGLTDVRFVHGIESLSGVVEGYPITGNFHGDILEWVGSLRSALDATGTFTMLELGAGWAPWCVIGYLAAKQRGIGTIKVIAVEADAGHISFIRQTFAANGIEPNVGNVVHGVVGVNDGEAFFPKANDASRVYGGTAAFSETEREGGTFAEFVATQSTLLEEVEEVRCFSLTTLVGDLDQVDLIHCDIQGGEANLFTNLIELISAKVRRVVIGTHSFSIDRQLACLFPKNGWDLEGINACVMEEVAGKPVIVHDGVQVWRNTRFE